ncbi:MAG: putative porin [Elusimicrobia bacterium]|nr:putative porin [Elusimicrobiota bacterium]
MRSKIIWTAALLALSASAAKASDMGPLLDKLAEKNIITADEARQLKAGQESGADLPSWLKTLKFRGDMRLRADSIDNSALAYREHRGRLRLRAGLEAVVNDGWTAGFGLASGSSADSRSTNQTLNSNFSKINIYLDYAFAEYKRGVFTFYGGRMRNPLWTASDMLWDGDINPGGAAFKLASRAKSGLKPFATAAWLALDESASNPRDPFLAAGQAGFGWSGADKLDIMAAVTYYGFGNVKGAAELANRPSTTSGYIKANRLSGAAYHYGYDAVSVDFELNKVFSAPFLVDADYLGLFGSAVKSTDHSVRDFGWIAGVKLGQRKVESFGQWQLRCSYRRLEADAWVDTYPDSDFYGGSTGVQGSEALLALGVVKNVNIEADYYSARRIAGSGKEHLLQLDLNLKF